MKKNFKRIAMLFGVSALALNTISCGSSNEAGGKPTPPAPVANRMQVGTLAAIPTNADAANATYPLTLFNNTRSVINITSVKATGVDPRLKATDSQLFDASSCRTIPVNGSCSIMIKASALRFNGIGSNGQFGLSIDGKSERSNVVYHEDQVISYENFVQKNSLGTYYNASGATTTNIVKATQMGVTIPVYFDKSYQNVKLVSPNVNSTLIGCGLINPDGTYNISAHSTCSIVVDFRGGKTITSDIKLLANYKESKKATKSAKATSSSKILQSGGNAIVSVGLVNMTQSAALMTTGIVTSSIPTDDNTTQTVTFVNNGMSNATGISLSLYSQYSNNNNNQTYGPAVISATQTVGNATLTILSNTCSSEAGGSGNGTVAPTNSCAVTFKISGTSQFGTAALIMSYSTGLGTATTNYNTYYYPPGALTNLSSSAAPSASEFINTHVGTDVRTMVVTVTNTTPGQPITLSSLSNNQSILKTAGNPSVPAGMTVSANTCTSGLILNQATPSCQYTVTFDPSVVTSGQVNNLYGIISGTYVNQGVDYQVSTALNMPYSVFDATDLTFNPTQLQLTTNVSQKVNVPLSITNTNGNGTGDISSISFNWNAIGLNNASVISQAPSNCLTSLPYGDTCNIVIQYAPTAAESSDGYQSLPVTYSGGKFPSDDIPTSYEAIAGNTNIQVTGVIASDLGSPPVVHSGSGTSGSPYTFYNYGNSFGLNITYTNQGTVDADNFMIDGSSLPSTSAGWVVDTANTTCGTGGSGVTLAPSASCVLALQATNPNLANALTYSADLSFNFPNATYQESGQSLVRNVWDYNSQAGVNVATNQILAPIFNFTNGPVNYGVIESVGGVSYYVYPITLANNANAGQTAGVSVSIDPSAYDSESNLAGIGASNETIPSPGAYTTNLAGGASQNLYLWIPTTTTGNNFNLAANWAYGNLTPTQSTSSAYTSNAAVGVVYSVNGGNISAIWAGNFNNITPNSAALPSAIALGSVTPGGTISNLIQYQGYLYALTTTGVYSYSITPWVSNNGTFIPDNTDTTGSGALTAISSGASQTNGILNDTPGALAINSVSGTTYAVATQSGTQTTNWPYTIATISNGAFSNTTGNFTGLTNGDSIVSAAVGTTGNIYLATSANTVYYCGTVTAVAACQAITLPGTITTAASNTTLSSLALSSVGGNIVITQYVTDPNVSGQVSPTTRYAYSADAGASTTFANVEGVSAYMTALPFTYFYNLNAAATTANQLLGMSGQSVSYGFNSPYTHSYTSTAYSVNLSTNPITTQGPVGINVFGSNATAFYSFLTIDGQN